MVSLNDICHICLEDIEYTPINIIKKCCDAFICNTCWLDVRRNPGILECPICRKKMEGNITTSTQTSNISHRSCLDNYRGCIINIINFLSWIFIGFLSFIIILLIVHYENIEKCFYDIQYVCTHLHFWIVITFVGFIVKSMCMKCFTTFCS